MSTPTRNPVGWFEIYVQDMDRAKAFYQSVFQITLEELPSPDPDLSMWVFPGMGCQEQPGCTGALCKMKDKDSGAGGTIVYFSCEDCASTAARVAPAGGRVHLEKMSIGDYGFIALVVDPDGNMIGLHSMQ
jgi:predicted enzyme related to lactoylglutathione lyase